MFLFFFISIVINNFLAHLAKRELRSIDLGNFIGECLVKDMEKRPFAKQLIRHPFFAHLNERMATIRKELKEEIHRQRNEGVLRRQAEVTTKHGQLKPDRKSKPQKIYMDDLGKIKTQAKREREEEKKHQIKVKRDKKGTENIETRGKKHMNIPYSAM